jgi:hypothetical protein
MENQNWMGIILVAFVIVIMGLAFISESSQQVNTITGKEGVSDESYNLAGIGCYTADGIVNVSSTNCNITIANAPTGWKAGGECPITNFKVTNSTGSSTFTLDTDYGLDLDTGLFWLKNTGATNITDLTDNVTLISYNYCGDSYQSGWGSTILGMVPGFMALGILLSIAFIIVWILKREGIMA